MKKTRPTQDSVIKSLQPLIAADSKMALHNLSTADFLDTFNPLDDLREQVIDYAAEANVSGNKIGKLLMMGANLRDTYQRLDELETQRSDLIMLATDQIIAIRKAAGLSPLPPAKTRKGKGKIGGRRS